MTPVYCSVYACMPVHIPPIRVCSPCNATHCTPMLRCDNEWSAAGRHPGGEERRTIEDGAGELAPPAAPVALSVGCRSSLHTCLAASKHPSSGSLEALQARASQMPRHRARRHELRRRKSPGVLNRAPSTTKAHKGWPGHWRAGEPRQRWPSPRVRTGGCTRKGAREWAQPNRVQRQKSGQWDQRTCGV